jgi:hypothetical protein
MGEEICKSYCGDWLGVSFKYIFAVLWLMEYTEFFSGVAELARDELFDEIFNKYGTIHIYLEDGIKTIHNYPLLRGVYVLDGKGLRSRSTMPETTAESIVEYNVHLANDYFLGQLNDGTFWFRVVLERKWSDVYYTEFKIGLFDPVYGDGPYWANMHIDAIAPDIDWGRYWAKKERHFLYWISIDYLFTLLNIISHINWKFEHLKYVSKGELIYALIESGIPLRFRGDKMYACLYRYPYYKTAITETMNKARKIHELTKYIGISVDKPIIIEWHRNNIDIYNYPFDNT